VKFVERYLSSEHRDDWPGGCTAASVRCDAAVMILPFITDRGVIGETERELFRILRFFSSQVPSDWFGYIEFHCDYLFDSLVSHDPQQRGGK
jgi:hypothetical protein